MVLRLQEIAQPRRLQVDADDAPWAEPGLEHIIGEFGLMTAMKGADPDMRPANR